VSRIISRLKKRSRGLAGWYYRRGETVKRLLLIVTLILAACPGPRLETTGPPPEKSVTRTSQFRIVR
jgi:hypothetical protein